jgi:hypothetical protein
MVNKVIAKNTARTRQAARKAGIDIEVPQDPQAPAQKYLSSEQEQPDIA